MRAPCGATPPSPRAGRVYARGLAQRLKPYEINSRPVRMKKRVVRGYVREDFHDAWSRYLPAPPPQGSATSATAATCTGCGEPMIVVEPGKTTHPTCRPRRAA